MHTSDKATVNPYLTFNGNCTEAMTFYKDALGGELEIMNAEEAPVDFPSGKVMHATLKFGDAIIMASDSMGNSEVNFGNSISVSISDNNLESAQNAFANLSEGGKIIMPFEKTFWGAMFGIFVDKYGINWMINCQLEAE